MSEKILLVEDNPKYFKMLKKLFENEKYTIIHTKSGKEVFQLLETKLPDLVILDLVLPDVSGFDLCEKI
ncbi:MAG: DNA-binding response regulator, partial [Candidatus Omnitrophota bacterium]